MKSETQMLHLDSLSRLCLMAWREPHFPTSHLYFLPNYCSGPACYSWCLAPWTELMDAPSPAHGLKTYTLHTYTLPIVFSLGKGPTSSFLFACLVRLAISSLRYPCSVMYVVSSPTLFLWCALGDRPQRPCFLVSSLYVWIQCWMIMVRLEIHQTTYLG